MMKLGRCHAGLNKIQSDVKLTADQTFEIEPSPQPFSDPFSMRFRIRQIHIESSGAKLFDHKVFIDLIKYFGINGIIFANKAKLYFGYFADGNPFELHIRTNRQSTDRLIEIGNKNLFFGKEIGRSKKDCRSDSNQYSSKDKNAD